MAAKKKATTKKATTKKATTKKATTKKATTKKATSACEKTAAFERALAKPNSQKKPAKLLAELDVLSDSGTLAIYNPGLTLAKYNNKVGWWWDQTLTLSEFNRGSGLIIRVGDLPDVWRVRVFRGAAPRHDGPTIEGCMLMGGHFLVAGAEMLTKYGAFDQPLERIPLAGAYVDVRFGVHRVTVNVTNDALNVYHEYLSSDDVFHDRRNNSSDFLRLPAPKGHPCKLDEDAETRRLVRRGVMRLRLAKDGPGAGLQERLTSATIAYLKEGSAQHRSPLELRDYFDVSYPSMPAMAGYNKKEERLASQIFGEQSAILFK